MSSSRQPLFKYAELNRIRGFLASRASPLGVELVDPVEAVGCYLAEDIVSPIDVPVTRVSHVDGYAVSECDGRVYRVVEKEELGYCEAVYVETGQPVPDSAIAVVPVEATRLVGEGLVEVYGLHRGHSEIIEKGFDIGKGRVLARKGSRITPVLARLLVELGVERVRVYRKPRVYVLPTGSEFARGVKRESSSLVVKSMCEAVGASVTLGKPVEDSPEAIAERVSDSLPGHDVVVTIGGVSLGLADYTLRGVLSVRGSELAFRGLMVQPGRATSLALVQGKPVVMLPGLFQSTVVGSIFLLQPVLKRLQGSEPRAHYPIGLYRLAEEYTYTGRFASFTRVRFAKLVDEEEMEVVVEEAPSPVQRVVLESHGFVVLKPGETRLEKGSLVKLYRTPGLYPE